MLELSDKAFDLTKDLDIKIRGSYLRFSAYIEGILTKYIICLNEVKTIKVGKEEFIDLAIVGRRPTINFAPTYTTAQVCDAFIVE